MENKSDKELEQLVVKFLQSKAVLIAASMFAGFLLRGGFNRIIELAMTGQWLKVLGHSVVEVIFLVIFFKILCQPLVEKNDK